MPRFLILTVLCFAIYCGPCSAQSITFSPDQSFAPINKEIITGINNPWLYFQVEGTYDTLQNKFTSSEYSDDLIDQISPLHISNLRFPGGTLANFYHFYGAQGYGGQSNELECRSGLLDIPLDMKQRMANDNRQDQNAIVHHVSMVNKLEASQGNNVSTNYVLNILTHYINGDFLDYNWAIDSIIKFHFEEEGLDEAIPLTFRNIDEDVIPLLAPQMNKIMDDPLMQSVIEILKTDNNFVTRVVENLAALNYLKQNDIDIQGIELGNELYFYYMLFDDDLSEVAYDCLTYNDEDPIQTSDLTIGSILQGTIKYLMLYQIYDEAIKEFIGDYKLGLTMGPETSVIAIDDTTSFRIQKTWRGFTKLMYFWNLSMALHPEAPALIQHHYVSKLWECGFANFDNLEDILPTYPSYFEFYFDHLDDFIYEHIPDTIDKEIWITEWNIKGTTASNTMVQAGFIAHFFDFFLEHSCSDQLAQITSSNYHNLIIDLFYAFALINAEVDPKTGKMTSKINLMYYPFLMFSEVFQSNNTLYNSKINFSDVLPIGTENYMLKQDAYFNVEDNIIEYVYSNYSNDTITISLDSIKLNNEITKYATIEKHQFLNADKWYSSNQGCANIYDSLNQKYFDYSFEGNLIIDEENLILYPNTLGNYRLRFEDRVLTSNSFGEVKDEITLYPNPNQGAFTLSNLGETNFRLRITDVMGKVVTEIKVGAHSNQIDLDLNQGTYFANIFHLKDETKLETLKFTIVGSSLE